MEIRTVTVDELCQEGVRLFEANNAETGVGRDDFEVDVKQLRIIERVGGLIAVGLFGEEDELLGYCILLVAPHPFSRTLSATCLTLFVTNARRTFGYGVRMMEMVRELCRERGVGVIRWSARPGTRFHRQLERTMELSESVFEEVV